MGVLFVDETKAGGYLMAAVAVSENDLVKLRKALRKLVLPGQRRLHFTNESDARRRQILAALVAMEVGVHLFSSRSKRQAVAREACLVAVVSWAVEAGHTKIVLERDDSLEKADRRLLYRQISRFGLHDVMSYGHEAAHAEPLLWIADAVAWSVARGGSWRARVAGLIWSTTTCD
ncbi:hypothetical protein [Frondihabitans australicus]|uniref:DUF3800 domain-containing protein n=1 Tax=Frondihabitans australicus TaxID=386892 RepID=A0A495IIP5_9MICO|nr:hypothetical protein [Frondihabitans australicus]RKR75181.1 hypothetical protein C8E83_2319 [Frondihabitans australicus]